MSVKLYRIFGPPGTGKTTELTRQVAKAADHYGGENVMVCSYTTAAAAEIARRVEIIPENCIGTLHKFCFEAIGKMAVVEEKRKSIEDWNIFAPAYAMSLPGCKDMNSGLEYGESFTLGDKLFAQTTVLRNRLIPREQWPEIAQKFYSAWKSWKGSVGGIDYTDMLEIALQDVSRAPTDPSIIFVDEAQDCTALQIAVLMKWAKDCDKIVMVGDDDQTIYQFAGATPEAFAAGEIDERHDKLLTQSYRLPYAVWEVANDWIEKVPDRVSKFYLPKDEPEGFVNHSPYTFKMAEKYAEIVFQGISKGKKIMVIGSCSFMVEPLKKILQEQGIPYHNPYRLIRADWNPLKLSTGTTYAQRLIGWHSQMLNDDRKSWTPQEFIDFTSCLKAEGVFRPKMKGRITKDHIERVDLNTMFEYLTDESVNRLLKLDLDWWEANLVNDEARRKAAYALRVARKFGPAFLDVETAEPEIILGTIHSVKGGEADIVIIFPDLSQDGMKEWTGGGKSSIRRLMYVGMTRAKEGLIIGKPASPYCCDL